MNNAERILLGTGLLGCAAVIAYNCLSVPKLDAALSNATQNTSSSVQSSPADSRPTASQLEQELFVQRVNINTATVQELEALDEIGPTLAKRIVEHRKQNGPFVSVDALTQVKGIGQETVDLLREQLTVE
ncbi:MAG: helix-hairpin-helix domain-containing protein [Clostridia bacterium]|nr:helix-hairpin-helix domain-containing protein [Clostridia bacterium]